MGITHIIASSDSEGIHMLIWLAIRATCTPLLVTLLSRRFGQLYNGIGCGSDSPMYRMISRWSALRCDYGSRLGFVEDQGSWSSRSIIVNSEETSLRGFADELPIIWSGSDELRSSWKVERWLGDEKAERNEFVGEEIEVEGMSRGRIVS